MAKKSFRYQYARPAVTVDLIIATAQKTPRVLLIRRGHDPFAGKWALPGGFVDENETLEAAARRELLEETGVTVGALKQFRAYGDPGRDPRGWTVSVVFAKSVKPKEVTAKAGDDASAADWFPLDQLPELAFDHARILGEWQKANGAT